MPRFVALLRGINVGRGRVVKMEWLRRRFADLGFSNVRTFIASGNVMFESRAANASLLERTIRDRLRRGLGYDVAVFIRTPDELQSIAASVPFAADEPGPRPPDNVVFLAEPPEAAAARAVLALGTETDDFRLHGRELYWRRRRKPGTIVYTTVPLEKALRKPFTIRTVSTVAKLAAMCRPNKGERDAEAAARAASSPARAAAGHREDPATHRKPRQSTGGRAAVRGGWLSDVQS